MVCNYIDDIYYLRGLLIGNTGFRLLRERDYIKNPKSNGYRSLHLIVNVPFMIAEGRMELPVEIQLRTIAMDHGQVWNMNCGTNPAGYFQNMNQSSFEVCPDTCICRSGNAGAFQAAGEEQITQSGGTSMFKIFSYLKKRLAVCDVQSGIYCISGVA